MAKTWTETKADCKTKFAFQKEDVYYLMGRKRRNILEKTEMPQSMSSDEYTRG